MACIAVSLGQGENNEWALAKCYHAYLEAINAFARPSLQAHSNAWAYKQADAIGFSRAITKVISLLADDAKNNWK